MIERLEVVAACVVGVVDSKTEQPPNENFRFPSTFIRLAGGALTLRVNGKAADCPADGELAIFQCERSRSGHVPRVVCWGWIASVSPETMDVTWVKTLGGSTPSTVGIKREAVSVNGK